MGESYRSASNIGAVAEGGDWTPRSGSRDRGVWIVALRYGSVGGAGGDGVTLDEVEAAKRRLLQKGEWDDLPDAPPPGERVAKVKEAERARKLGPVFTYPEALDEYLREEQRGDEGAVDTGWPSIDGGLGKRVRPGELVVIGARASVGKTWVAQRLLERKLRADADCAAVDFTMEMPAYQMAERLTISAEDETPRRIAERAYLGKLDADEIMARSDYLRRVGLYESMTSIEVIPLVLARARERLGLHIGLIVVDYTQLLAWEGGRNATLYEQATMNMRRLKDVAKAARAVIVAAAQLSRGGAGAGDREPNMASLRDSGAAEEAADRVLMFWRDPVQFGKDGKPIQTARQEIRAKVEKNRHGPRGARALLAYGASMELEEVNEYDDVPPAPPMDERLAGLGDLPF